MYLGMQCFVHENILKNSVPGFEKGQVLRSSSDLLLTSTRRTPNVIERLF